jgi:hypothetical protein
MKPIARNAQGAPFDDGRFLLQITRTYGLGARTRHTLRRALATQDCGGTMVDAQLQVKFR